MTFMQAYGSNSLHTQKNLTLVQFIAMENFIITNKWNWSIIIPEYNNKKNILPHIKMTAIFPW